MFTNEPTNPKIIVANILSLSDSWKELLGPAEEKQAAPPRSKGKRATSKRKARS
jgi:hypothetical protein